MESKQEQKTKKNPIAQRLITSVRSSAIHCAFQRALIVQPHNCYPENPGSDNLCHSLHLTYRANRTRSDSKK